MRENFEGPYVVKKVVSNEGQVFVRIKYGESVNEIRAHQL